MTDPRKFLDAGSDNMPSEPKQFDAPGAKLLKDPGDTDSRHSNQGYNVECDEQDISPNSSEAGASLLEEDKEPRY